MSMTNQDYVGKAIQALKVGLVPFVSQEFIIHHSKDRIRVQQELQRILHRPVPDSRRPFRDMDPADLLRVMWVAWNEVYRDTLGRTERSLVSELQDVRNRWAHLKPFSSDDTYRALDSSHRLLKAVSAPQAGEIERLKMELQRVLVDEQVRLQRKPSTRMASEGQGKDSLRSQRKEIAERNRGLEVFFGEEPAQRFWKELAALGIDAGTDGADINLSGLREDLPSFARSLVGALEVLLDSDKVSRRANRSDKFAESLRRRFLDSPYHEVHAALFDLSQKHPYVWVQGQHDYGLRTAHKNHSSGVSLVTSNGPHRLVVGKRR